MAPVAISDVQTGVTEGKADTQSGMSSPRASSEPKYGACAGRDGFLELVGPKRVDEDEAELALPVGQRSERSPSYFSPAAWRRVA